MALKGGHGDFEPLHKALLAGLLSHVGQRHPEDRSYQGARNRSFHIFPGSGLFGKTPPWIMAAEIVETSKPYARINARIEPAWVEEQGRHLLRRHYFDPHWSRRRGRVQAWEQVSLFGLVLVEKRRVDYTDIDPAEARRLFLLEALVRGNLDSRAPFLEANRQARAAVERLEHKRRQRDVLADEQDLFDYFDAQVPEGVATAKAFAGWLESLDEAGLRRLHLGEEVLMRGDAGSAPVEQFPDGWSAGGHEFPLDYRFEPGDPADGVSLHVPLPLLNTLDPARLSWQVPGLRRERVTELMKTLPKPLRRALTPLPQFADAAIDRLEAPGERSLPEALAVVLRNLAGVEVSVGDFDPGAVPDHLALRIVVEGEDGTVVAEGRDLAALQERLGRRAQREFMDRQGDAWNRDGLEEWPGDELPAAVKTEDGATAYPALVDQASAVGLRLFDTWDEAALSHQEGIHRLLALALPDKFRWMRKQHGLARDGLLAWSTVGEVESLVEELAWRTLVDLVGERAQGVRDAAAWDELLQDTRRRIGPAFQALGRELSAVLSAWGSLNSELEAADELPEAIVADMRAQLDDMIYPGFLLELEPGRLAHFPRYLQGLEERLERARLDPGKDLRLLEQVTPWWRRYQDHLLAGEAYTLELDAFRWLVAEFRVSIFAQRLGTDGKVSSKRLETAWRAVQAA